MLDNPRPRLPEGCYALVNLPQAPPIGDSAMGTGWWEMDQIWRMYPGQFTVMTGLPGSGKSTLLLNMIANMSELHGIKTFVFSPENERHILAKFRAIWGKRKGWDYFVNHQVFVQSTDGFVNKPMELRDVLDRAVDVIVSQGIDLLIVDPWNELEHLKPRDVAMTDYIRTALMYLKGMCRCNKVPIILVAHPTKAVSEHGGRVPTLADIEGSMAWFNKCDNGLIVHREEKATKVISAKVREYGAGKVGKCLFYVDEVTGLFTPMKGAVDL
jgi:twinkle protein